MERQELTVTRVNFVAWGRALRTKALVLVLYRLSCMNYDAWRIYLHLFFAWTVLDVKYVLKIISYIFLYLAKLRIKNKWSLMLLDGVLKCYNFFFIFFLYRWNVLIVDRAINHTIKSRGMIQCCASPFRLGQRAQETTNLGDLDVRSLTITTHRCLWHPYLGCFHYRLVVFLQLSSLPPLAINCICAPFIYI